MRSVECQSGVALAMLLWFVAAMSIMVAGIMAVAKVDARLASLQVQVAQAAAVGDGAANLMMKELLSLQQAGLYAGRGIVEQEYTIGEHEIRMRAIPVSGLVDLNLSSEELLVSLFQYGAGLEESEAVSFAHRVMDWREDTGLKRLHGADASDYEAAGYGFGPRNGRFEVVEDLLQVLGINRALYDSIAGSVHATGFGQAAIDPLSAPESVLNVLAQGDIELVRVMIDLRLQAPFDESSVAGLPVDFLASAVVPVYRLDAWVSFPDGRVYQRRRWGDFNMAGQDGLPWRFLRTEPVTAVGEEVYISARD
ncbi:general secretion pathway protein GspK [Nitrincola alkalilacustris]|uniref:general secretion pathway protein GspK n=1 Tax=Nitrincola alkalilacustris TaxID=1571224 RepID=UPI00124D7C2D|nr:type II secretion system protein GspK [Nitrincola alkalilacustris]